MQQKTVAVIDNDADLVALMSELLEARGLVPVSASDITTAREVIRLREPALILLDLWLDAPDAGWTIIQDMHQAPETEGIPIVVVTGGMHLLPRERVDWLHEHHVSILSKPFDLDEFDRCIDAALAAQA